MRLEYPANTVNVAHQREAWQVDAGPVALPVEPATRLPVARLRPAYLVYNRWDYAEFVAWAKSPVGGGATHFYARRTPLACRHALFTGD